jgi:hypothetical protein
MTTNASMPFEWAFQHLQLIGWPALCVIAWKAAGFSQKFIDRLDKQDTLLNTMNESLKEIAINTRR